MSLVNMTTGEPAPARQQLRQLNEMSRQELENSLLKEVLADYTEKWNIQQQEQTDFRGDRTAASADTVPTEPERAVKPYTPRRR